MKKIFAAAAVAVVGFFGTIGSCIYLVFLGYQADASEAGGDGVNGWWQLAVSLVILIAGIVLLVAAAKNSRNQRRRAADQLVGRP